MWATCSTWLLSQWLLHGFVAANTPWPHVSTGDHVAHARGGREAVASALSDLHHMPWGELAFLLA